ncbi:SIR2 family anti-phage-associated protein [Photobacterium sp. J15]|uniref:SIR2 family anti-phage-associated protein n=1 Tax=Photobacterium sp. J15 TaxID=265901 RepID=UPI0007E2FF58|nr:SIR2 family anti-phage-associated protein [Photobacterium sp. J15]
MADLFFQGGTPLTKNELESHLASLCQLENVGLLLGAGASRSAGGYVMQEVWQDFMNANEKLIPLLRDEFNLLCQEEIVEDSVNVELLIDQVLKFLDVAKTKGENTEQLEASLTGLYKSVTKAALLVGEDFPKLHVGKLDHFEKHRRLLEKLLSNRQPGQSAPSVFTTNYDLAIEWAAEEIGINVINGFVGNHSRTFQPHSFDLGYRNINAQGEARFGHYCLYLYKLHGSLTWLQDGDNILEQPSAMAFESTIKPLIDENDFSGKQHLIFPGANKYHHTIGFVYGEMFRRFGEFLSKPQTALFVNGYGFGDYHINRLILGALLNPSLHIVIFYPDLVFLDGLDELTEAQRCIDKIRKMNLNQITIVGGTNAYFNSFVDLLPKPVLFPKNNAAQIIADAIRDISNDEKGTK